MSLFEDYDQAATSYDEAGRKAVCVKEIVEKLKPGSKILDAGCGTGNYLKPLLDSGKVVEYTALDANENMLNKFREKADIWEKEKGGHLKIDVLQCSLAEPLPFDNEVFDVIIHNQVMHHLTTKEGKDKFVHVRKYLKEFYRVLKGGGILAINNCTPEQCSAIWWIKSMPSSSEYFDQCGIRNNELKELLLGAKFSNITFNVDREPFFGDVYYQYEKFLSAKYQNADSAWAIATPEEKEKLLERISKIMKDESMYQVFHDEVQKDMDTYGHTTEVFAVKDLSSNI